MEPDSNTQSETKPPRPWKYPHRRYIFAGLITFGIILVFELIWGEHWLYGPAIGIPTGLGVYLVGMALTGDIESFGHMIFPPRR